MRDKNKKERKRQVGREKVSIRKQAKFPLPQNKTTVTQHRAAPSSSSLAASSSTVSRPSAAKSAYSKEEQHSIDWVRKLDCWPKSHSASLHPWSYLVHALERRQLLTALWRHVVACTFLDKRREVSRQHGSHSVVGSWQLLQGPRKREAGGLREEKKNDHKV